MNRNDPRPETPSPRRTRRRWQGAWLAIALVVATWCSHLAGQNVSPPTFQSPNIVTNAGVPKRTSSTARKLTTNDQQRLRSMKMNSTAKPVKRDNAVVPASHDEFPDMAPSHYALSPDVTSGNVAPSSLPPLIPNARPLTAGQNLVFPTERTNPPQITGTHLGLHPGETATERSLRLMNVIADLEQQNAELAEQNAKLQSDLKAKEAKLQSAAAQINAARKELLLAQDEFQRLRKENVGLREKFRSAEQENVSLMRSLSPLLKQIWQNDEERGTENGDRRTENEE